MRLLASILALAIIGSISAVPVPPSSVNPCTAEALNNLLYFHPSLSGEPREFIECNPWGGMMLRMCPEGSVWDRELVDCMFANRTVMNTTFNIEEAMLNETMGNQSFLMTSPFCSYVGNYTCQNNGICSQLEDGFRCMCLSGFSGDYCERVEKESVGIFGIMINSSFSFDLYRLNRAMFNMSSLSNMSTEFDLTFNGSTLIDEATRVKISSYMARYTNGSIRFDTLVNFFIDDFLSIIFPDAFMMREFYLEPEIKMGFSNAIPRLLMITKYTYDNFEHLFSIFDDILIRLSDYLIAQQASIKEEAAQFYEVYAALNARLDTLYNISDSALYKNSTMDMERVSMRELFLQVLRSELNSTLIASYELFRGLVELQNEISRRQQFGEITMEQIGWEISNFTVLPETVSLINEIITRSNKMWDILSYYGFSSVLQRMVPVRVMPTAGALVGIDQAQVADQVVTAAAMMADEEKWVESRESEPVDDEDEEVEPQAQLSSNVTMPAALMAENSTVERSIEIANVSALMAENSTVERSIEIANASALMAENSTVLRSVEVANASAIVVDDSSIVESVTKRSVVANASALMTENSTVERSIEIANASALMAENSTVVRSIEIANASALMTENSTVVRSIEPVVDASAMMAENTTVVRSVEPIVNASAMMAENSTVVRSTEPVVDASALMVENSTVVRSIEPVTVASAMMAENSTVVTPAAQLAEIPTTMTSTVATPAALIVEATTQAAQLVAENAITTPTAAPSLREALETVEELTVTKN